MAILTLPLHVGMLSLSSRSVSSVESCCEIDISLDSVRASSEGSLLQNDNCWLALWALAKAWPARMRLGAVDVSALQRM